MAKRILMFLTFTLIIILSLSVIIYAAGHISSPKTPNGIFVMKEVQEESGYIY